MPSRFDQRFAAVGFPVLLAEFGESITYTPLGESGRTFDAILERSPPSIYDSAGNVVTPAFIVRFHNDATLGVAASEIDTGGDTIELVPVLGSAVKKTYQVIRLISQDSGVCQVAVR